MTDVGGVVIYDALDEPAYPPRALVLGVGVDADGIAPLVGRPRRRRAPSPWSSGLPSTSTTTTRAAVDASGVALLGLARGATWAQLAALLRSLLADGDIGEAERESIGGLPSGDLFAVANAIAALLDAPITIEDRSSRVLAFSGRQEEADASRAETIIGRQVPERYARILTERGIFRDLYRYDRPVVVDPVMLEAEGITTQRIAIGVRAGDEVLGSIWAAMDGPLTPARAAGLRDAAKLVALHLLRIRAGADVQRRLSTELVGTALEGGARRPGRARATGTRGPARHGHRRRARARAGRPSRPRAPSSCSSPTRALRRRPGRPPVRRPSGGRGRSRRRRRVRHLPGRRRRGYRRRARRGDRARLPRPGRRPAAGDRRGRTRRVGCHRHRPVALGRRPHPAGPPADAGITARRARRRRPARVARARAARPVSQSRRRPDGADRAADRVRRGATTPSSCRRCGRGSSPSATSRRPSASQFVHANTFRYRLRRVQEISGLDLDDPDARFAAMLQLRMLGLSPARLPYFLFPCAATAAAPGGSGLGVEVLAGTERLEVLVQPVDQRDAGGDVELGDVGVADAVEVLDEPAQRVAVRRDQHGLAGAQIGDDVALPVGQEPVDHELERLGPRDLAVDADVARVVRPG